MFSLAMASPDISDYDLIPINSSAEKDSQASLDAAVGAARVAGERAGVADLQDELGGAVLSALGAINQLGIKPSELVARRWAAVSQRSRALPPQVRELATAARGLPNAVAQNPACGTCGAETVFHGDRFVCEDCQLTFDVADYNASFLDPASESCGVRCDNTWHGDHNIRQGIRYDCGVCGLPAGHESLHWPGCRHKN